MAFGTQIDFGAFAGRQHHHCHDAFAIDRCLWCAAYSDRAVGILTGNPDKLRRRSGMQTQFVDDFDFQSRHRGVNPLGEVAVANLDVLQSFLQGLTQAFGQVDGAVMPAGAANGNSNVGAIARGEAR